MNLQPFLEDEIIRLRPLKQNDFDALYQVAKDPMIWEQHPSYDRYKTDVFSAFFEDSLKSRGALIAEDKSTATVIGSSRYKRLEQVESAIEIGWSFLARAYWGGRYNGAMKKLMIQHAFHTFDTIIFYIGKDNLRSQKAVEKIGGIKLTGPEDLALLKEDGEDWTFAISRENWSIT